MANEGLNEQIQDKVYFFSEKLNSLVSNQDNTYVPKTIKQIDKLVNELYQDLYGLVDVKKTSAIEDKKCGHCG